MADRAKIEAMLAKEDPDKLAEFEERIARGEKIEPGDWMPELYRKTLIRFLQNHANSEIMGALPEGEWIPYAPSMKRKLALIAKVQDEVGHGQLLYMVAETLGKPREKMIEELLNGKGRFQNVFNYPAETWADVGIIGWLIDGAAMVMQSRLRATSYGPYARALARICYEETFHLMQGYDIILTLVSGTKRQREMVQDALNRWWGPIMQFFGPADKLGRHPEMYRWKLKLYTNDQNRQKFLSQYVPKIRELGLTIPDPNLRYDEEKKRWVYTEPDWDELFRVINGDGPMTKERLALRRLHYAEGRWIREALQRFAERRAA